MFWVTSDHHFGHERIIEYTRRPFASVKEMDTALIERWNSVVQPGDTVYHLGDFALGGAETAQNYLRQLNGVLKIVPGGHDRRWVKTFQHDTRLFSDLPAPGDWVTAQGKLVTVLPPLLVLDIEKHTVTLCHYPLRSWEGSHYGHMHFHGHSHGTLGVVAASVDVAPKGEVVGWRMDVGVDCHEFYPWKFSEAYELLRRRRDANVQGISM